MVYKCIRCGYSCAQKNDLRKHYNRKKTCTPIYNDVDIVYLKKVLEDKKLLNFPHFPPHFPPNPSQIPLSPENSDSNAGKTLKIPPPSSQIPLFPESQETNEIQNTQNLQNSIYSCPQCSKSFTRLDNLKRHLEKSCKKKMPEELTLISNVSKNKSQNSKGTVDNLISTVETMAKQIELLQTQNTELIGKVGNNTTINNNTIENQQNINIQINSFGNEVTDYITPEYIQGLFNGPYGAVPKLLEQIHFHPDHPENWNVKITNDKKPHAQIYDGKRDKWIKRDKKETIVDMVEKGYNMLDDHFSKADKKKILDNKVVKKFKEFQDRYDKLDKDLHRNINKTTHLMIMNESLT